MKQISEHILPGMFRLPTGSGFGEDASAMSAVRDTGFVRSQ